MTTRELKKFLRDHPPKNGISVADLADFQFRILLLDNLNNEMDGISSRMLTPERLAEGKEAEKRIAAITTPEEILREMRKSHTLSNLASLAKKALQMQDEVMQLILDTYRKTRHTIFTENASKLLANADTKYTEELVGCYKDIWHPYAQSLACLLFGYHGFMDTIPLLLSEYDRFKRLYPDETYDQCPLKALGYLVDKAESEQ